MNIELDFILNILQNNRSYSYSNPLAKSSGRFTYDDNGVSKAIMIESINYEKAMILTEIYNMKSEDDIIEIKTFLINQY